MTDRIDDLLGDDEDEPQSDSKPAASKDNAAFAQMRKELRDLKKEADELRAFRVDREKADRETAISGVFTEVGLNPKHAKLFTALNPEGDATPELVAKFATEYGLVTNEGEGFEMPQPASEHRGFTPTVVEGGSTPAGKTYNREEFDQIMRENPVRGRQLAEAGKVHWNNQSINEQPQR